MASVMVDGHSELSQDGRTADLHAGDLVLYDSARPFRFSFSGRFDMLVFQLERSRLTCAANDLRSCTARTMNGHDPRFAPIAGFLRSFDPSWDVEQPDELAAITLDLVSLTVAAAANEPNEDARRTHRPGEPHVQRALSVMSQRCGDPDLDPAAIASACNISLRYLHALFSQRSTTVRQQLTKMRLDRARGELSDVHRCEASIAEIALRNGFSSSAHFSRVFKRRYQQTPTEVRNQEC